MKMKRSIAVVLLVLSVCHAQPWTQQAAPSQSVADPTDGCECGDVDNCIYCTTTDPNNPCYNKCQWCIPQLSCQKVDLPGQSNCPPPPPPAEKVETTIGAHQQFKCQDQTGNGPIVNQVLFTTTGGDSVALWNGTDSTMASDSFAGVPTNPVKGEHTISTRGLNWGEQNKTFGPNKTSMLGTNQVIRICPFANMDVSSKKTHANPDGPSLDTCFNCTEYGDAVDLDLRLCNGGVPPGYQPTDKHWPESNKNAVCSRLTCTGIPPGIGGNYAVFVSIHGEPPSLVVGEAPPLDKPQATAFTTQYARLNYALPVITKLASSNSGMSCTSEACEAAPGDVLTVTADNLPNNDLVVETYRRGLSPEAQKNDIVYIQLGDSKCPIVTTPNSSTTTEAVCTVPLSSGRGLNLTLVVAGQASRKPSTFNYPEPIVKGVSPATIPSYGGSITVTGHYFADKGSVDINDVVDPAQTHACEVVTWSEKEIVCTAGSSGGAAQIRPATVTVTVASGNCAGSLTYAACSFSSPGESCLPDGKHTCSNNYACQNGNCNAVGATCTCPDDSDGKFCGNGGTLDSGCHCKCVNGWANPGHLVVDGAVPPAYTNGTCSSCPVSCGGLDKKIQTSSKCGCEFNKLHLIWIVFLGLLALGAIGFGIWKWQSMQPKKQPLLNEYASAKTLTDEEHGDRREAEDSVTEM